MPRDKRFQPATNEEMGFRLAVYIWIMESRAEGLAHDFEAFKADPKWRKMLADVGPPAQIWFEREVKDMAAQLAEMQKNPPRR